MQFPSLNLRTHIKNYDNFYILGKLAIKLVEKLKKDTDVNGQ